MTLAALCSLATLGSNASGEVRAVAVPDLALPAIPESVRSMHGRRFAGGDASKTWTGTAGNGLWTTGNNWSPTGAPAAGDTLTFPTLASPYSVTNDQSGSPIYALIALDGTTAGKPTFNGGFSANELIASAQASSTWNAGVYDIVGRSTFRGLAVTTFNAGATLRSNASDHALYLWEQASLNVNAGAEINVPGDDAVVAIDDATTLNVNAGGSVRTRNALISNDAYNLANRTVNVIGENARMRADFQTLIHTDGFGAPSGAARLNVHHGATYSTGIFHINPSAAVQGTTTTIDVYDATFEVRNAVGFENSYFINSGSGADASTTISIGGGGQFLVADTDDAGEAFAAFGHGDRTDTFIEIGGANAGGVRSTMKIDGSLFCAAAERQMTASDLNTVEMRLTAGGRLIVRDATVFSTDNGSQTKLDMSGASYADLGHRAIFSGGSPDLAASRGAGATFVNVAGESELRARSFEVMDDPMSTFDTRGTCLVDLHTGSRWIADGVDDPSTPEIDSGFFAASRGNGQAGSDLGTGGDVSIIASGGALIRANEAFFAGDMQNGQFSLDVRGTNTMLDAGGLFAVNGRGLAGSVVVIGVSDGATLAATAASNGSRGSIRINPAPGSGTATVTISNGGTLQSAGSIQIGGTLVESAPGLFQRTIGTPATVNGSGGSIIAGAELFLAAGSMLTSDRFDVHGTYIDGTWLAGTGGPERRIRTGDLRIGSAGSVTMTDAPTAAFPTLVVTGNLSMESAAKFDLKNHAILIRPDNAGLDPTTLASLRQLLATGRSGTGAGGISSSVIGPSTALGYGVVNQAGAFLGEPTQAGDLLVRFTLKGDADLNGAVNFDDLLALAQHYGAAGEWFSGDFTFDGAVNFDDLLLVAQNYGSSLLGAAANDSTFAEDWQLARGIVPEPLAGVGLFCAALFPRRRR